MAEENQTDTPEAPRVHPVQPDGHGGLVDFANVHLVRVAPTRDGRGTVCWYSNGTTHETTVSFDLAAAAFVARYGV